VWEDKEEDVAKQCDIELLVLKEEEEMKCKYKNPYLHKAR
jgi:hypothetical protein